jgi:protein subunit release factor A
VAGNIAQLVDELERSYQEAQERMSDPAVYNDHREAAAAGRRLKELEAPHKLAQEWRQVHPRGGAARRARADRSGGQQGRHRRDSAGRRRRRGRDLGR